MRHGILGFRPLSSAYRAYLAAKPQTRPVITVQHASPSATTKGFRCFTLQACLNEGNNQRFVFLDPCQPYTAMGRLFCVGISLWTAALSLQPPV